jgi:hypothetical protein
MGNHNRKNAVMGRQSTLREGDLETIISPPPAALRGDDALGAVDARRRAAKAKPLANGVCAERKAVAHPPAEIGELIGKELRNLYDDVVAQPVPDRFLDLLNQLEISTISSLSPKKASEAE